jgi:glycosyltransferase involved in cell wall biosynthesis
VVAFGGGGVEEWLFDGESGLRVPERTPEALSGAVQRLLEDRALRDRLAAGAQRHYPKFHPDRYLDRLEESYGKTLAGWKRGRAGT